MDDAEKEGAEKLLRIDRQFLLEERAGRGEALFFSLTEIGQGKIVVNARVVRVELDGFFELTDCFVEVARLAIGAPEKNVEFRSRAHVVQYLVKQKLGLSQLVLTEVGQRQRIRRLEVPLEAQSGVEVFRGRGEVALRELDVSQQLQRTSIARVGFDDLGGLGAGLVQVACTKISHGEVDMGVRVGGIGGDGGFE